MADRRGRAAGIPEAGHRVGAYRKSRGRDIKVRKSAVLLLRVVEHSLREERGQKRIRAVLGGAEREAGRAGG